MQGNFIGTNAAGSSELSNQIGVSLGVGATGNTIGGIAATPGTGPGNVIVSYIFGAVFTDDGTSGNKVQGNVIKNARNGVFSYGVFLDHFVAGNTIGGTEAGAGNRIAFTFSSGVSLAADAGAGNAILGNSIFLAENSGTLTNRLGIDLGDNGVTPNDSQPHTGANNFQNFPVLTSAVSASDSTTIVGHTPRYAQHHLSPGVLRRAADPSGIGQERLFLGSARVDTNADGHADFCPLC